MIDDAIKLKKNGGLVSTSLCYNYQQYHQVVIAHVYRLVIQASKYLIKSGTCDAFAQGQNSVTNARGSYSCANDS